MNIYILPNGILRLNIWNVLGLHEGHFTIWFQEVSNSFVFAQFGGYGNLVSYREVEQKIQIPTQEDKEFWEPKIKDRLQNAVIYGPNWRDEKHFVLHATEMASQAGTYITMGQFAFHIPENKLDDRDREAMQTLLKSKPKKP